MTHPVGFTGLLLSSPFLVFNDRAARDGAVGALSFLHKVVVDEPAWHGGRFQMRTGTEFADTTSEHEQRQTLTGT